MANLRGTGRNAVLILVLFCGIYWLVSRDDASRDLFGDPLISNSSIEIPQNTKLELCWSADGSTILSRSVGSARCQSPLLLHSSEDGVPVRAISPGEMNLWDALLLPDASAVILFGESRELVRIDVATGSRTCLRRGPMNSQVTALAATSDSAQIAVAIEPDLLVCDAKSGQQRLRIADIPASVTDLFFSPDDRRLIAAMGDGSIRIWNALTGAPEQTISAHLGPAARVRLADGMRTAASVGLADDMLRVWDLATGALLWEATAGQSGLCALAITPDGTIAATGGTDQTIRLWNLSGQTQIESLVAHTGRVQALQFSPDGAVLTSGARDGTIRYWSVGEQDPFRVIDVQALRCDVDK